MTLLSQYQSSLRREKDKAVKEQKKLADLTGRISDKWKQRDRSKSSLTVARLGKDISSLSDQQAKSEQTLARIQKRVADLEGKVLREEQKQDAAEARRQQRLDRERERIRKTLERNVSDTASAVGDLHRRLTHVEESLLTQVHDAIVANYADREYDLYLLHASPDTEDSTELFAALTTAGLNVWFDEDNKVSLGLSLFQQMNAGNARSHAGVVLITEAALAGRYWLEREIGSFLSTQRRLIPILHGVERDDLNHYSPFLADLKGLSTADFDFDEIALMIAETLRKVKDDVDAAA